MNVFGQDIDPLAVAMCKINGALYAPWMSFPLPPDILGTPPIVSAEQPFALEWPLDDLKRFGNHHVGSRTLFDP